MRVAHVSDQVARVVFLVCAILLVLIMLGVFIIIGSSAFRIFFEGATVKVSSLVHSGTPRVQLILVGTVPPAMEPVGLSWDQSSPRCCR